MDETGHSLGRFGVMEEGLQLVDVQPSVAGDGVLDLGAGHVEAFTQVGYDARIVLKRTPVVVDTLTLPNLER